jgi:riboflavin synthase
MFTGIITELGSCLERTDESLRLECSEAFASQLTIGSSVSVNGVCLTVTVLNETGFSVDVMGETWQRTALGNLKTGDTINLELAMGANGRFDGHMVQGHVDGTGKILAIEPADNSHLFTIQAAPELTQYMIEKGSVCLNGISLTIIGVTTDSFSVGIIPHTYTHTMLHQAQVGNSVNIEIDMMAKYVMKFIKEQPYEKH